ncbi:MAG: flagellar export chaperone FliS [Planctomycetota bacterium]|nr:MAG: flagellar export chaperone FliS [Planctomycetota bacterium]
MTPERAAQAYGGMRVTTTRPQALVLLLYERALLDIDRAQAAAEHGEAQTAAAALRHARSVVLELLASLDRERGGELATNLAALYDFAFASLAPPARREEVDAVREVLDGLLDAYRQVLEGQHAA